MLTDYSPAVPYQRQFSGNVTPGFHLNISGHVPYGCGNFQVNLKCGFHQPGFPEPNIALHLSFRFNEKAVVRNTNVTSGGTGWGPEERNGGFPLSENAPFQLDVYAEAYSFKIHLNNNLFADYKYRLPLNTIKALSIVGNVTIYQINSSSVGAVGGGKQQTPPPPYTPYATPQTPGLPIFVNSPSLPTTIYIPGNMRAGMTFCFSGTSRVGGDRFHVSWLTTTGDSALQFNPRLRENTVVRNTKTGVNWGREERSGSFFPFAPGMVFNMLVRCHASHYEVVVNGQPFTTYAHRIQPITAVNAITIVGDVTMHSVNIAL